MARRVSISFPTRYYDPDNPVSGEGSSALNNNNYGVTHPPNPDFMGSNDDFREDRNCSNGAREQENDALDPIALPQSTHTLLFTQPVFSLPFGFAVFILLMCLLSLLLCLIDRIYSEGIPANVTPTVRTAQFLAIFIAILVEEEIPTGLYLLRMIPRQSLHQKFPEMNYGKFIFSSLIRILIGYLYLANILAVVCAATEVLEMFYDMLALSFVQQLDDAAFILAKMELLGRRMQRACTSRCYRTEFGQKRMGKNRRISVVLKAVTIVNLCIMLSAALYISSNQIGATFYTEAITVDFGSTIWETAWATTPLRSNSTGYEERMLIYSFFNGIYVRGRSEHGRPVYVESSKEDASSFENVMPAEFKYCKEISAWVFMHKNITKSKNSYSTGCESQWLLRSPETKEYDLLKVVGSWQVWTGYTQQSELRLESNVCRDETDCNLNGICQNGKCLCNGEADDNSTHTFLGFHCEVRLPLSCETVINGKVSYFAIGIHTYFLISRYKIMLPLCRYVPDDFKQSWAVTSTKLYSRPKYKLVPSDGTENETTIPEINAIFYAGNRWFCAGFQPKHGDDGQVHAFWGKLETRDILYVSSPTLKSTPVGVNFHQVMAIGEELGPFGALKLYQDGHFRCEGDATYVDKRLAGQGEPNKDQVQQTMATLPCASPIEADEPDAFYKKPDMDWKDGYCISDHPAPNGAKIYETELECCTGAFAGQDSGACLAKLPSRRTA